MKPSIRYPAFEVYGVVAEWLEQMEKQGKVLDDTILAVDPRLITRGDIGALNARIREKVEYWNPNAEVRT